MTFFQHLEELRSRLKIVFVVTMAFFLLFLVFSFITVPLAGVDVPVPVPAFIHDNDPIANKVFRSLVDYLKPEFVNLTAKAPWDGVVVQLEVALFLALVASAPVSAYEFGQFIGPALREKERKLILRVAAPVLLLFLAGVLLALVFILPFTFNLLYTVQRGLGISTFLLFVDDFVSFVLLFLIAFGLSFELPVLMYGLSVVGIASAAVWRKYWRFAVAGIFVFGAIITPDGSGVTMLVVAFPMVFLYAFGYLAVLRRERRVARAKSS
ncbi:MAG: hypothetical protein A3K68_05835 [Euryarchaeota archaeon RBG_16_68_13]|nr:MAG: hypothetical protein A3K68_05835 [Euryarchaeota archaeon RBG_16_68_13]